MDGGNANCKLDGGGFSESQLGRMVQPVEKVELPQNIAPEPARRQKVFGKQLRVPGGATQHPCFLVPVDAYEVSG